MCMFDEVMRKLTRNTDERTRNCHFEPFGALARRAPGGGVTGFVASSNVQMTVTASSGQADSCIGAFVLQR